MFIYLIIVLVRVVQRYVAGRLKVVDSTALWNN